MEQKRFHRHLKSWYETRRFRIAPQIQAVMVSQQKAGRLTVSAARIKAANPVAGGRIEVIFRTRGRCEFWARTYGAIINCTGPGVRPDKSENPLITQLVRTGGATLHPCGQGFMVDHVCRAFSVSGKQQPTLRIIGPLTRGCFMETGSVPAVSYQIFQIMPDILAELHAD